ncbi:phage/plasmid primase, P4 family [Salinispora mooreana]|uniref:phage/plasmid primase, P4 family n=3 Tax=Salinispora mooreana TaxID=999545 RepID=UPI000374238D|nr:phage/plasmid primase, P4 family [Salinispora mooreana]
MTEVQDAALAWHDAGACVLPAKTDGSKAPAVGSWVQYQTSRPTRNQIESWFAGSHPGLGLICGAASGNLEMLELEGRAVADGALTELTKLVTDAGMADLWLRVTANGYAERTPSGGLHILYRLSGGPVPGNTKLASRPARDDELTNNERAVLERNPHHTIVRGLAETRGEGGFVVVAPSAGTTHPTGRPWEITYGHYGAVPTISRDEREQLHRAFRCLDQTPTPESPPPARPTLQLVRDAAALSPGDDFERKTDWADNQLLGGAGWQVVAGQHGGYRTWRRPGKDTPGISATTGKDPDRDRLYVFSSSTEFDTETPYTKFGAYAVLHHGGDHTAAARHLTRTGHGTPTEKTDPAAEQRAAIADLLPPGQAARVLAAVDGTAARVLAEPSPNPEQFGPTEAGMARALVANHGDVLRYCPQRARWLMWDGHRWAWDDAEQHRELLLALADRIPNDKEWATFRKRAMSAAGVTGIARLAQHNPHVVAHFDDLDANAWELNTPAGIVDLRTGTVRAAEPAALHTRSTAVPVDLTADLGRWNEFLADTFGDNDELITYLRRLVGYSAVGHVGPHVLPFCHGSGGNGKGVFLEALAGVLGDYATTAPVGFLMAQSHPGHETEIARLAGSRMVICSEVNDDDRFDEAKVKMLTGGDSLTARFMRQDHFTFTPSHQLWLMGNHQPAVRSGGRSFWRRLRLIPFEHEVPEEKIVDDLQGILVRDHGPALLAWITAGTTQYHASGLQEPARVKAATAEYAHDQDSVAKFVQECCHLGGGEHVTIKTAKVREAYEQFCYAEGEAPVSAKALGAALEKRFKVLRLRTPAARLYGNLSLLIDDDASSDASSVRDEQGGW